MTFINDTLHLGEARERRIYVLLLAVLALGGCQAAKETGERASGRREPSALASATTGPRLARPDSSVRTVQLYAGSDERRLPVLARGGPARLTLEFDLLVQQGRPLSVYFYHADRQWERDPVPARYLDGFRSGALLDYTRARADGLPYVHYAYRFPERDVGFRVSGNYVLRVTEQGEEDEVLFERAFFVAEGAGTLDVRLQAARRGTQAGLTDRPALRYRPPRALGSSPFDFAACFVPGGQLRQARCVEGPRLSEQPVLLFELPLREGFASGTAPYFLDLSRLQPGGEITTTDRQAVPRRVLLEADYAEFAGAGRAPLLNGQPVVRRSGLAASDPEVSAEYASVRFRFAPPKGHRLDGPVVVTGSFSTGGLGEAPRLRWQPAERRYEGDVLLKQGLYEYRYAAPDAHLQEALAQNLPPARRRYAAFVYYRDASLGTDRLLSVQEAEVD